MKVSQLGLRQHDVEAIVNAVKKYKGIKEAILFGSRAKGNYSKGSDVDIAIKGDINFKELSRLNYQLNQESMMPYKFDILQYAKSKNTSLKNHIDRVGIILYKKDILLPT